MNTELKAALAALGARFDAAEGAGVADFGNPAGELAAASTGGYAADLSHYGLLAFEGADARDFLHAQLTCDVAGLAPGHATYGGYCTAKGRLLATFLLWPEEDSEHAGWRMLLPRSITAAIQKRLRMFVLRAKVKIEDVTETAALIGVGGKGAAEALAAAGLSAPAEPMQLAATDAGLVIALPGHRWLAAMQAARAPAAWQKLSSALKPVGAAAWQWTEIRNGIPNVTARTQEQFVPQMANLERIGGVSFKKGCYPGQEIVARTQYLGKVKRRMYLAHSPAAAAAGDELFSDDVAGQGNGLVVEASASPAGGYDLLAVVQEASAEGSTVHLGAPDGPAIEFRTLPYPG